MKTSHDDGVNMCRPGSGAPRYKSALTLASASRPSAASLPTACTRHRELSRRTNAGRGGNGGIGAATAGNAAAAVAGAAAPPAAPPAAGAASTGSPTDPTEPTDSTDERRVSRPKGSAPPHRCRLG